MKVIIDIEPELFKSVVEISQENRYMSDVWLAVAHGEPYKIGKWIPNFSLSFGNRGRYCSLCGKVVEFSENFCPNCGADMRGNNHND